MSSISFANSLRRHSQRGAAYILALTTLLVGLTLALAMLRAGGAYFAAEDTRTKKQNARNLAEAGIDYAFWQVHYNGQPLPYSKDLSVASGSIHVEASDDGNNAPSTMLITSTGTCNGHSYTSSRVTIGLLPYHYAYCENRNADDGDMLVCTSSDRGMRANGDMKLDKDTTVITSGAWVSGSSIQTKGIVTPQYTNCPPICFPEVDYSYYSSIADYKGWGDIWFSYLNPSISSCVVYVSGKVFVQGWYRGKITIVATDNIEIVGDIYPADSNSFLALITQKDIKMKSGAVNVTAIMYAHKSSNDGDVLAEGFTRITGVFAADDNHTQTTTYFERDSRLNLDVMRQLRLPGL